MLDYNLLDDSQLDLIDRIYGHDATLVYATMGSGKTVCYLTAASELLSEDIINRVLIVAPLRPCNEVWAEEHKKWAHLQHLDVAVATGSADKRLAAINSGAQIVVINIENLVWFLDTFKKNLGFDALCIDELSKFSNNSNKGVKKLRTKTKLFKHHVGLTGTPVHESFLSLFSQCLVLDGGDRLGRNFDTFKRLYFYATDYNEHNWELLPSANTRLLGQLKDLIYSMPDYTHTLPKLTEHLHDFELSDESSEAFKHFAKHSVIEIGGVEIVAENAAVLSGKLEQFNSGFLYVEGDALQISDTFERFEAFKKLVSLLCSKNCLIFYTFEEEKQQIIDALGEDYSLISEKGVVDNWNAGKIKNLVLHPKSAGHGLNLAGGGHTIILYSPIWSNDMYKQLVGRLWRRGQKKAVDVHILRECLNGLDDMKLQRVTDKSEHDAQLKSWLASLA